MAKKIDFILQHLQELQLLVALIVIMQSTLVRELKLYFVHCLHLRLYF